MQKKWFRLLFRRRVFVILLLLLQVALMVATVYSSSLAFHWVYNVLCIISFGVVLYVISTTRRGPYKLIWAVMILSFPLFGGLLYLLVRFQGMTMAFKKRLMSAESKMKPGAEENRGAEQALTQAFPQYVNQANYLTKTCGFRLYHNESTTYLTPGEVKFEKLLSALERAEKYIFLEYFIIQEGKMWNSVLDILCRKAKEGVDVRLIYDDLGCFLLLPHDYEKHLLEMGIRAVVFNRFRPALSTLQNHRDHRKIAVIDGKWAFTGGVNLADEYINERNKHGHWKDASVMISGAAAGSFALMFLSLWQALTGEKVEPEAYLSLQQAPLLGDGFVIPYCDNPIDDEYVGEKVYMNLVNGAREYLYIQTPYLILDDGLISALTLAAKNGVDVKILTPGIPDKWYVHMTTRSYYKELLDGGIQIYEYTPGFIHSKVMVADDRVATVGTTNLDCRSLYLHFECGAWLCGSETAQVIRKDFLKTLEKCCRIKVQDCRVGFWKRLLQNVLRLFAPLM